MQKIEKILLFLIVGIVGIKCFLLWNSYYNIDIFIYSYIAEHIVSGEYIHSTQFFPPLNYLLQVIIHFFYRPESISEIINIGNIIGFIFSLLSLFLVYDILKGIVKNKNFLYVIVLFLLTVPYLFFNSVTGDTANIYSFFITFLGWFYLKYNREDIKYYDIIILSILFGLLITRKESFIVIGVFLFINLFLSKSIKKGFLLIFKFLLCLCLFLILFKYLTGSYFYIEVLDIFKGLLGYPTLSSNTYHQNILNNLIINKDITGISAGIINGFHQFKNIILTFGSTITFFLLIFGFGGGIYYGLKVSKKYLLPIFLIIGILGVFFVLAIKNFQGAVYNIDIFFAIDGVESFQRYFVPFIYLFAILSGIYFYKYKYIGIYLLFFGIILNVFTITDLYNQKWKFSKFDNYVNSIETYGGLGIKSGYMYPGNIELSKFLRKNNIDGNILYLSAKTESAQIINMSFLARNKNVIIYYKKGTFLPGNNTTLIELNQDGFYLIEDNYKQITFIGNDFKIHKKFDKEILKKYNIHYIEIDANYVDIDDYFKGINYEKYIIFNYENIYLLKMNFDELSQ